MAGAIAWLAELKRGTDLVFCTWKRGEVQRRIVAVRRVTPTGRVALMTGYTFLPDGREWGAISDGHCHWLERLRLAALPDGCWHPMDDPPFPPHRR